MKRKRLIIGLSITFCIAIVIWFVGWAVRTKLHVWETINKAEYENTVYVLMFLAVLFGSGLTVRKSKTRLERPDMNNTLTAPPQKSVDLGPINKRLDVLDQQVADLHVVIKFLKNLKEKEGEKA